MPVLGLAGRHWRKWKLVQVRRLASQSVSPDQMGVFVGSGPKWSAATPCKHNVEKPEQPKEVLHLCRWSTHTHTPRHSGADKMTMKVKWKWQWNESYLTRTRRGERKRRGKERTPTQTHLAQNGQTLKGQEKKNRRPTETEPELVTWYIHTACKIRDQAQRPSAVKSQPCERLKWSTLELRAHWNRTNDQNKKSHHTCKYGLCLESSCLLQLSVKLSSSGKKELVGAASSYACRWRMEIESQAQRAVVQHCDSNTMKHERRLAVSLYLNNLLGWKM